MSKKASSSSTEKRWIAVILARAGSKGIKGKNVRPVAGRPLIAWSIEAALRSEVFDEVWVSTDGDDIARVADSCGAKVHRRAPLTATDEASSELGLLEFAFKHDRFDVISLIQCTSPLVVAEDFRKARALYEKARADSLVTVHTEVKFFWKYVDDPGLPYLASPANYYPYLRPRRQEAIEQKYNVENGAFYFTSREVLLKHRCRVGERSAMFHLPAERAIDIDDEADLMRASAFLERREAKESEE